MNPLPASAMTPIERRAELCRILALGLLRLHQLRRSHASETTGEGSLHSPPDQCRHATPTHRRSR
jgi:hypothetical protein